MMCYLKKLSIGLFTAYCLIQPAYAEVNVTASAKILQFDYEEFDLSGASFNKETGFIPGLSLSLSKTKVNFTSLIAIESYDGQVDYDGQTQSGLPHPTDTEETLHRVFYKLNWSPESTSNDIYGKIAWQQWDRNILPANNVSGLFEQYEWWTLELGLSATLFENKSGKWQFEFGVLKTDRGTIKIDLIKQGFGQPELDLGDGIGATVALSYQHMFNEKNRISLNAQHQHWSFGRSNTETISNGLNTFDITEPKSVSKHSILSINYGYYF